MNTPTTIEFAPPAAAAESNATPWSTVGKSVYQDLVLKPEYQARRYKFPNEIWFRILPALRGSKSWMLPVHCLNYQKGRHIHPKTLTPGAKSVFDRAYQWYKVNRPEDLFSKTNKEHGIRLLCDRLCVFWIIVQEGTKTLARLVVVSGNDGSWGGAQGIGHKIWELTQQRDEDGNLIASPVDPIGGVQICVEKTQPQGSRFPSYSLRLGRVPAPMDDILKRMDPSELAVLTPIENVVRVIDEDTEWKLFENVIDPTTIAKIRAEV